MKRMPGRPWSALTRQSGNVAGDSDLAALRRHQRRLVYGGGGLLTTLVLSILVGIISQRVTAYLDGQLDDFRNAKTALDALFVQREAGYVRTLNMSEYVWRNQRSEITEAGADHMRRFVSQGQRALVSDSPEAMPWLVLGSHTDSWPSARLDRYLGLVNELSITARTSIADRAQQEGTSIYFYDPTASFFAFGRGITYEHLISLAGTAERELMFARMSLPQVDFNNIDALRSARRGNQVLASYGADLPKVRTSLGINPMSGERAIVGTFVAMDGDTPIGAFAVFEPAERFARRLRDITHENFALLTEAGETVFATGDEAQVRAGKETIGVKTMKLPVTRTGVHRSGGEFSISEQVKGTDWTLVRTFTWRDVIRARAMSVAVAVTSGALVLFGLWYLLIRLDRRIFSPTLSRASRVYQSEELNRNIILMSPVGLCLVGMKDGKPVLQNDIARGHAALISGRVPSLYDQLLRGHARSNRDGAISSEYELSIDCSSQHGRLHLLVAATRITYNDSDVLLCVLRDITARAELEERLRQTRRDSELARTAAESASRAKSTFVASISHEIRTPLNGILGHLELFGRTDLNSSQRNRLASIRQSTDSLMSIISDVLDFSKIEAGQLDIEIVPFDLRGMIEDVIALYAPAAQVKGVALDYRIEAGLPIACRGGRMRIEQILRNLVSNAVKFTASGRVLLRVSPVDNARHTLRFQVVDSGIGMSAEQQALIFEPFVQADVSIARRFGGTGLGLALCRQMSDLLGGSISVESTPGVGSMFTVDLPVAGEEGTGFYDAPCINSGETLLVSTGTTLQSASATIERESTRAPEGCRPRALLVDDHPVNLELGRMQLEQLGFCVDVAENGEIALASWEANRQAIVLTDIQMPRMDGYELCQALRTRAPELPVLAITASTALAERERCKQVGMTALLLKPVSLGQLDAATKQFLKEA